MYSGSHELQTKSEDEILRAFQALDVDKKGYLDEAELRTYMTLMAKNSVVTR